MVDGPDKQQHSAGGPLDLFWLRPGTGIRSSSIMPAVLWLLNGRKLMALTANAAVIETPSGSRQTYRRSPVPNRQSVALAWEATPMKPRYAPLPVRRSMQAYQATTARHRTLPHRP